MSATVISGPQSRSAVYVRFLISAPESRPAPIGHFEPKAPLLKMDYWELALRNIKGFRPKPRAILLFAQRVAKRFVKPGSTIVSDHYLRDCSKNGPRRQR